MTAAIPVRTTVFERMSARAVALGAVNLGQGFPDSAGPASVRTAAARAVTEGPHHYPRMRGTDPLRSALAAFYAKSQSLHVDPDQEIIVTSGATEALACAIFALVEPGDGVLVIEPAYDSYVPVIRRAGGVVQFVTTRPPLWKLDRAMLEAAITPATRAIIVNDPGNPTGWRLDAAARAAIRDVALAHGLTIIADEVWEEVRPPGSSHRSLALEPSLRDRIVKIGSAGKIFQLTGWKVGWMLAAPALAARLAATHQYLTFTTPPALQQAVAEGLAGEYGWLETMRVDIAAGRRLLAEGLTALGYAVLPSDATWFLSIDLAASGIRECDIDWCDWLVETHGVAAIPVSSFFETDDAPSTVVRFCHAKAPATIAEALRRMPTAR